MATEACIHKACNDVLAGRITCLSDTHYRVTLECYICEAPLRSVVVHEHLAPVFVYDRDLPAKLLRTMAESLGRPVPPLTIELFRVGATRHD